MVIFYNFLYVCQRVLGDLGKSWDDRIHFTDMPVLFLRNWRKTYSTSKPYIIYIYIYLFIYLDAKPMTFSFLCFSPKSTDWNLGIQHGNTDPSSKANKLGQNVSGWWFHPFWKILVSWVSWGYYSQYIGKNKKCSKPPARYNIVKWPISIFVDGFNWPTIWQWVSSACAA